MSETYLGKAAFAASQGWSPSYITKLGHQGRLVFCADNPSLIDVAATLTALGRTGDEGKEYLREHHATARVTKYVTAHTKINAPSDDVPGAPINDPKYWDNKTRREGALATLAELELSKRSGELVDRKSVEAVAFATGRMLRDAMLGIPTQLAPEFASMNDAFQIEGKLREAIRQIFTDASKMAVDDLKKAMEIHD